MSYLRIAAFTMTVLGMSMIAPVGMAAAERSSPHLVEFHLPDGMGAPGDVVAGADGSVWVSDFTAKSIAHIARTGEVISTVSLTGGPSSLSTDNDGGVWASEYASNAIARVDADGTLSEYPIRTAGSFPTDVYDTAAAAYFTQSEKGAIGRIDKSTGEVSEMSISSFSRNPVVLAGAPGYLVVVDGGSGISAAFTESASWLSVYWSDARMPDPFRVEVTAASKTSISQIAATPKEIASVTYQHSGAAAVVPLASGRTEITDFVQSGDDLWFTDKGTNSVVRVPQAGGHQTDVALPTADSGPSGVAVTDAGRYVWVSERHTGMLTRIDTLAAISVNRISGADRYDVAVAAAVGAYPAGASTVFLASGEKFADALSAGPVAAANASPLLLTQRSGLPPQVFQGLATLHPDRVVIVGGPASVSPEVEAAIGAALPDAEVRRIDGPDRYAVSRALLTSDLAPQGGSRLYIANGQDFPDALSSAAAAARYRSGVLLVNGSTTQLSAEELAIAAPRSPGRTVVIAGGPRSVSAEIEFQLRAQVTTVRIGGVDRYAASAAINAEAFPHPTAVYVASGASFPDALAAGPIAGAQGRPIYLAHSDCVPSETVSVLRRERVASVTLIGGPLTLQQQVADLSACA